MLLLEHTTVWTEIVVSGEGGGGCTADDHTRQQAARGADEQILLHDQPNRREDSLFEKFESQTDAITSQSVHTTAARSNSSLTLRHTF